MDLARLRRQLQYEMTQLPQYSYLDDVRIEEWIDTVLSEQPESAMFHMNRLFQFGGSEIGALIQSRSNLEANLIGDIEFSHLSDQDIFDYKYLTKIPTKSEDDGHLLRGSLFEPVLAKLMRMELAKKYSSVNQRPDLVKQIVEYKNNTKLNKFDWARVQVDDIWQADDKLILTDYKFPTASSLYALKRQSVVMYAPQVTLGKMIAHELGIPITDTIVSPINIEKCQFENIEVPFDKELEERIMDIGTESYALLKEGKRPVKQMPKYQLKSSSDLPDKMKGQILTSGIYRLAITELTKKVGQIDLDIEPKLKALESNPIGDFKIAIGNSNIIGKWENVFDKEKAVKVLQQQGMDEVELVTIKNNKASLQKALRSFGLKKKDIDSQCCYPNFTVDASNCKGNKGEQFKLQQLLKDDINAKLDTVFVDLIEDMIELDEVTNTDEVISKKQAHQVRMLKSIIENAPTDVARNKAQTLLEQRLSSNEKLDTQTDKASESNFEKTASNGTTEESASNKGEVKELVEENSMETINKQLANLFSIN